MKRTKDNVTVLRVHTIAYESGPACPVCDLPRVWRRGRRGETICGTGEDCGRTMSFQEPCWTCRQNLGIKEIKMKAIIDGTRYDTDKATMLGSYDYGWYPGSGDFSHWRASLYRGSNNTYFLAGEGGAQTQFAEHFPDGMRGGGERIIPLTSGEALEWAERYLDPSIIEHEFCDLIKDA